MNRVFSTRITAHSAYGYVCAVAILTLLIGLCLAIGGVAFDIILLRNIGFGTFMIAASWVLVMVLVVYLLQRRG